MPEYSDQLSLVFHALADGTRRAMVERLTGGPASVSQLAQPFAMAMQSAAQHIGVLEAAGIVTSSKVGRVRTVQLAPAALAAATQWISRQQLPAEQRLDRLESFLAGSDAPPRQGE